MIGVSIYCAVAFLTYIVLMTKLVRGSYGFLLKSNKTLLYVIIATAPLTFPFSFILFTIVLIAKTVKK